MVEMRIDPRPLLALAEKPLGRPEGVAFSRCGRFVAIAEAVGNRVSVYARPGAEPGSVPRLLTQIEGHQGGFDYPHDVDISPDGRLLAVASRGSKTLTFHPRLPGTDGLFRARPSCTVRGRRSRLDHTDGVKFMPPTGAFVAAVNLSRHSVTFYRRGWLRRLSYGRRPTFQLVGAATRLMQPDGLDFSPDGLQLAVANHGANSVTIYRREGRAPRFALEPVAELGREGPPLCYPHSVAFSADGTYLAASNAGGRSVYVYRQQHAGPGGTSRWSTTPAFELQACNPEVASGAPRAEQMEGGSKGVAFTQDAFAVCNEHFGVRLHRVWTPTPAAYAAG